MTAALYGSREVYLMTDPTELSEAPPQPAQRRRVHHKPSSREVVAGITSQRQQMRDARAWAEQWYQALREWDWKTYGELVPRDLSAKAPSTRQMTPVVGNWSAGDVMLKTVEVITPMGWVSESALARHCNADTLLETVRRGAGLTSLVDERGGWTSPRERAMAYAVSVLKLAAFLGDPKAVTYLSYLLNSGD